MRHPLVDGQGNFGSVDGDSPAAMRYTEVRMTRLAGELLADIDKDTVDFGPNYDGSLQEPKILPCKFPNLLVSGSSGIAVGMATNIPPHNLGEVVDATCALINNPELTVRELMGFIPGPDFPTGGSIRGRAGIVSAYETGRGSIVVRAKTRVEIKKDGREAIIIDELPFQVNKARLVETIAELVRDKKIAGISDLRDESDRQGMRVVIETKRDASTEVLLNLLFKHTSMQSSFGVNAVALVNGQPQTLNLKRFLEEFINHRRHVVTRRTLFELRKAQARGHLLEGLSVALANIDRIIEVIRNAPNPQVAKEELVAELWDRGPVEALLARALDAGSVASPQFVEGGYRLSAEQAQAILDMRLHRLTGLEQDKIHQEFEETLVEIARLNVILATDEALLNVIKEELQRIKEMFANPRRTEILEDMGDFSAEDLIPEEEMVVTVSHAGYVKRQPTVDYRSQRRGGKGKSATGIKDTDFISQMFVASTHDTILCFTDKGRVFRLKVYEIPQASRAARGRPIVNLLALESEEKLAQILPAPVANNEWDNWHLLFATSKGLIKKTALSAYINIRANGIRAVDLQEGDDLVGVALLPVLPEDLESEVIPNEASEGEGSENDGTEDVVLEPEVMMEEDQEDGEKMADADTRPGRILLYSSSGKAVRFRTSQVRLMGRVARGVRGMRLKGEDRVIALNVLTQESDCQILVVTEKGYGKRTAAGLFPTKGRGTQGVIGMQTSVRNGSVVASLVVVPGDQMMLITDQGTVLRTPVETVRLTGRNAMGVKILDVAKDERLVSVARLAESEEEVPGDGVEEVLGDGIEEGQDISDAEHDPLTLDEGS